MVVYSGDDGNYLLVGANDADERGYARLMQWDHMH